MAEGKRSEPVVRLGCRSGEVQGVGGCRLGIGIGGSPTLSGGGSRAVISPVKGQSQSAQNP